MIPYLIDKAFDAGSLTPTIPTDHGLGVLHDVTYCKATHELNGEDELELRYPVDGALFDKLELRTIVMASVDRVRGVQPYRIYRITKPIGGIVTVYARHLAYDLAGIVVEPFTASGIVAALAGLKTHAMVNNPFTFTTTRATASTFKVSVPSSVWSLMGGQQGSLLDVYGGEYSFDGYTVSLENHIGSNRGVSVRYGVNMTDLEQDANCADCYTGVVAYWKSTEGDNVVYSPVVSAAGTYGYVKILSVDMSSKWEEQPTAAQLSAAASAYITANQIGVPKVSWKVGFVPLDQTEEYKDIAALEQVALGDTVTVKFAKLGVDATARVNKIEWDVLLDRYLSVSLGSVKANIADTIARQTQEIANVPNRAEVMSLAKQISTTLTNAILGAEGGSVRLLDTDNDGEPDTLYIADNPDPAQATKVWRFNYQGWAASSNGYNGPFTLGATLDNGLLADFVTAAHLTAGTIQSEDGEFLIDLSTGILSTTVTARFLASNYSSSDTSRISGIINGSITPTAADYAKYDFYQKGTITLTDLTLCAAIVNTGNNLDITWTAQVDPNSRNKTFSLHRILAGAKADSADVFTAGLNGITGANADIDGVINCSALYINGQPVTP